MTRGKLIESLVVAEGLSANVTEMGNDMIVRISSVGISEVAVVVFKGGVASVRAGWATYSSVSEAAMFAKAIGLAATIGKMLAAG